MMPSLKVVTDKASGLISDADISAAAGDSAKLLQSLRDKTGTGNDFLGWLDLPVGISEKELQKIENQANKIKSNSDILVVVGIGGSYLGARAVIESLSNHFAAILGKNEGDGPLVLFAGQNICADYLTDLQNILKNKDYSVAVISKSGTTTEPGVSFRLLKADLEKRYGRKGAAERITAVTDASKGALRQLAEQEGYETFVIPDDVGGRYSVLTPVGLLPIAVAGIDIRTVLEGAKAMRELTFASADLDKNPAMLYAAARNALYRKGKKIEILASYQPRLTFFAEWWKQLYGESEGKEGKGIFPASVNFTSDLHSMGQWIQEGERSIFETVISVGAANSDLFVPEDAADLDKLNYLAGKPFAEVNKMAEKGTLLAHTEGGVPNLIIEIPKINGQTVGQLIYFFEKACALSGYMLGVNPFDQPGVEAYKSNMFALLGKPSFEKLTEELRAKL